MWRNQELVQSLRKWEKTGEDVASVHPVLEKLIEMGEDHDSELAMLTDRMGSAERDIHHLQQEVQGMDQQYYNDIEVSGQIFFCSQKS